MLAQYEILTMCLFTVYNMVENVHFLLDFGSEHMFFLKGGERREDRKVAIFVSVFSLLNSCIIKLDICKVFHKCPVVQVSLCSLLAIELAAIMLQ